MRSKIAASVLLVLALLIPVSPAVAQTGSSTADDTTCQAVMYRDIRDLFVIDLDTASALEIRILANQISSVARTESLTELYGAVQHQLMSGTAEEIRTFLKEDWDLAWAIDLRIKVLIATNDPNAGTNVRTTGQQALDNGNLDVYLNYLNHGLYVARALDACQSQPA